MAAVTAYEGGLFSWLDQALRAMRHVHVLGSPALTTPTLSFTVDGVRPRQVAHELSRRGICAWDGDFYARELFDALGVNEEGGAVQLGLMHYNTAEEVGYAGRRGGRARPPPAEPSAAPCSLVGKGGPEGGRGRLVWGAAGRGPGGSLTARYSR